MTREEPPDQEPEGDGELQQLAAAYEVGRTVSEIAEGGYKRVALQFPDSMLPDAPKVYRVLNETLKTRGMDVLLFIVGDTSYGSCCVDEVSALHLSAELVVHFGPACLSPVTRLAVLYVFGTERLHTQKCAHALAREVGKRSNRNVSRALLFYRLPYHTHIPQLVSELQVLLPSVEILPARVGDRHRHCCKPTQGAEEEEENAPGDRGKWVVACGLEVEVDEEDGHETIVLYLGHNDGEDGLALAQLALRLNRYECLSYDSCRPEGEEVRSESASTNRELKRRFYHVQRAKDAGIIGIVVATLGVQRYLTVVQRARSLIHESGRKAYTLAVGKVNPAKLANFAEVEVFCLVACPGASLLSSRDYHAPIVTPLELEMALGGRAWDGSYSTDFRDLSTLLAEAGHEDAGIGKVRLTRGEGEDDEEVQDEEEDDEPYFSLVTGTFRQRGGTSRADKTVDRGPGGGVLIAYESAAGDFLQGRSYRGLGHDDEEEEGVKGEQRPVQITEGLKGIASDYGGV